MKVESPVRRICGGSSHPGPQVLFIDQLFNVLSPSCLVHMQMQLNVDALAADMARIQAKTDIFAVQRPGDAVVGKLQVSWQEC